MKHRKKEKKNSKTRIFYTYIRSTLFSKRRLPKHISVAYSFSEKVVVVTIFSVSVYISRKISMLGASSIQKMSDLILA